MERKQMQKQQERKEQQPWTLGLNGWVIDFCDIWDWLRSEVDGKEEKEESREMTISKKYSKV